MKFYALCAAMTAAMAAIPLAAGPAAPKDAEAPVALAADANAAKVAALPQNDAVELEPAADPEADARKASVQQARSRQTFQLELASIQNDLPDPKALDATFIDGTDHIRQFQPLIRRAIDDGKTIVAQTMAFHQSCDRYATIAAEAELAYRKLAVHYRHQAEAHQEGEYLYTQFLKLADYSDGFADAMQHEAVRTAEIRETHEGQIAHVQNVITFLENLERFVALSPDLRDAKKIESLRQEVSDYLHDVHELLNAFDRAVETAIEISETQE